NGARLEVHNRGELPQRGRRAVVVDRNLLEELRVGAAGTNRAEIFTGDLNGLVHLGGSFLQYFGDHTRTFTIPVLESKCSWQHTAARRSLDGLVRDEGVEVFT